MSTDSAPVSTTDATGGTFTSSSGGGVPVLDADHDIYILSKSATGRTLTVKTATGTSQSYWIVNGSREIITGRSGALTMDLGSTDSGVAWLYGPAGAFFRAATTGQTFPVLVASTLRKAETASADANVLTFAPVASSRFYKLLVQADMPSGETSLIVGFTVDYKDSNAATVTGAGINVSNAAQAGYALTITVVTGPARVQGEFTFQVDNSATNIVVKWVGGGTGTASASAFIYDLGV